MNEQERVINPHVTLPVPVDPSSPNPYVTMTKLPEQAALTWQSPNPYVTSTTTVPTSGADVVAPIVDAARVVLDDFPVAVEPTPMPPPEPAPVVAPEPAPHPAPAVRSEPAPHPEPVAPSIPAPQPAPQAARPAPRPVPTRPRRRGSRNGVAGQAIGGLVAAVVGIIIIANLGNSGPSSIVVPRDDGGVVDVDVDADPDAGDDERRLDTYRDQGSGLGSPFEPYPIGQPVLVEDGMWTLTVHAALLDASDLVVDAHDYNDPVEPGFTWVVVPMTATNEQDEADDPWLGIFATLSTGAGYVEYEGHVYSYPQRLSGVGDIEPGATVDGVMLFLVPSDEVDGVLLRVWADAGYDYFALTA